MMQTLKWRLAEAVPGRVAPHLLCWCRGGNRRFHWRGVGRESGFIIRA